MGLIDDTLYDSAVKGRQDFRTAFCEERKKTNALKEENAKLREWIDRALTHMDATQLPLVCAEGEALLSGEDTDAK